MGEYGTPTIPKNITLAETPTRLRDELYYRFWGKCEFLKANLKNIVDDVAISLKVDKPNLVLHIGDACLRIGSCDGHPTHANLTEIDFDYPLYSGKGTQYAADKENIWHIQGEDLIESKIDWWSTWQLIIRIKSYLKDVKTQFIIHEKVYDLIVKNINREEKNYFYRIINQDTSTNYHHHTHIHIRMEKQ